MGIDGRLVCDDAAEGSGAVQFARHHLEDEASKRELCTAFTDKSLISPVDSLSDLS